MFKKRFKFILISFMLVAAATMFGCADDGSDGTAGLSAYEIAVNDGFAGTEAEWLESLEADSTVSATGESCAVCHTADKIADMVAAHLVPFDLDDDGTGDEIGDGTRDETLTVTVNTITDTGGGILQVSFTLTDEDKDGVTGVGLDSNRFYISDIVPAGTAASYLVDDPANPGVDIPAAAGTWDTDYLERWAYERVSTSSTSYPTGTWAEISDGDYTYTFVTALGDALDEAPDYDATHVQRLVMRVDGRDYGYTRAVGIQDFMVDGTFVDPQRVLAPIDGCKGCHSSQMDNAAHGGSYLDTRACAMCHSPLGHYGETMQEDDAYASLLYHKIHSAIEMTAFNNRIWIDEDGDGIRTADERHSYDYVSFPQDVRTCVTCHTGNESMTTDWKDNPTMEVCGSCHEHVDFATGVGHAGGAFANNDGCIYCHPATSSGSLGGDIASSHDTTATGMNVPEFDVAITMTAYANGTHYVEGETPVVTVTLKNYGTAVDPGVYTTAQDDEGVSGGGLTSAGLRVYGPRAKSLPVLATGSSTDPDLAAGATPTQNHALFVGGTDALVATDATGFKYQLMAIPADMTAGTYMVRFEGEDYGGVSSTDYVTSSTAMITFRVGTATDTFKVAGDNCLSCHGDTRMHLTGSHAHNAAFDTDECLACHDQSGNYAIPLGNRAHAVHGANTDGDMYNEFGGSRDWSHITYPQGSGSSPSWTRPARCETCHDSGNATYETKPFQMPCSGCHVLSRTQSGDGNGALAHMRQNGGPF